MKQPSKDSQTDDRHPAAHGKPAAPAPARQKRKQEADVVHLLQMERRARAQAEAAMRAKDEFLAVVTHELRSPLNAIRGWSHVLRHSGNLQPGQIKALDAIDRNTQAQAHLVDDLLDSQRILCGKLQLEWSRVALRSVLDDAVDDTQPAAQLKRIRVEVAHDPAIGIVRVDPERLRQSLAKLLSNAVKFTPDDGIVRLRSAMRGGGVDIEVRDTGIGLDSSVLRTLFDRFAQADSSSTRRTNGLGLGLSLARQLIELHGGTIGVDSKGQGRGSKFTIELPASVLGADAAQRADAGRPEALAGKRVVIVEDDADGREVLGIILRGAHVELHSFECAADAYDYLAHASANEQPDALISDIAMPDEDGYAFIRRVRDLEGLEQRPHLVALALTAFARTEDRSRALRAGFDEHVAKPIDPERVLRTLVQALDAKRPPVHA